MCLWVKYNDICRFLRCLWCHFGIFGRISVKFECWDVDLEWGFMDFGGEITIFGTGVSWLGCVVVGSLQNGAGCVCG